MHREQCHHHRQGSRTYHDLDTFAKGETNCSICSSFVKVHTISSSQVQSSQPFAPYVRVLSSSGDTLSLHEVPKRSSILVCFFLSRKKYSSRNVAISEIAERHISSRIRQSTYSSPNHSRRYLLSNLWIQFHVFPPFAANSRTTCAVASPCSDFLKPSLDHRHSAARSSIESGSSSQTADLSINFDVATVVMLRYQCRYHWVSFKCQCICQFKKCCDCGCIHVTGFRGSSVRETHGTDVTDARCPASQHTHNESLIKDLQDTSINTTVHVQLSSSRAVHKPVPSCSTSWDSTRNLSSFSRASTQLFSARQALRHVQLRKRWRQPHAAITNSHRERPPQQQ